MSLILCCFYLCGCFLNIPTSLELQTGGLWNGAGSQKWDVSGLQRRSVSSKRIQNTYENVELFDKKNAVFMEHHDVSVKTVGWFWFKLFIVPSYFKG